ncbi:hypothetical protein AVHM3334_21370 [Acidovorax sp. SUPP3334]|nr:hypothetical protein AVHM3334_21370 [Acidovorax sp. SUPP3334]
MTTSREARNSASSTSWVMKKTVLPVRCHSRNTSPCKDSRVKASSAPSGSSISNTSGSLASTRAMPTRCCMPPESCHTGEFANASNPTNASVSVATARRVSRGTPRSRKPSATLSITLSQGISACFWNTTPRSAPGPRTTRPPKAMCPAEACVKPAMQLSSVVLPQPEAPRATTNSPAAMSRSTPARASTGSAPRALA